MKKLISISTFLLFIGFASVAQAQSTADKVENKVEKGAKDVGHGVKKGAKEVKHGVKQGAKEVGHKTAEVAAKGKATITDETYKDKVGPDGQTIYIDNHSQYYWVDKKGHRHYVKEAQLKVKDNS